MLKEIFFQFFVLDSGFDASRKKQAKPPITFQFFVLDSDHCEAVHNKDSVPFNSLYWIRECLLLHVWVFDVHVLSILCIGFETFFTQCLYRDNTFNSLYWIHQRTYRRRNHKENRKLSILCIGFNNIYCFSPITNSIRRAFNSLYWIPSGSLTFTSTLLHIDFQFFVLDSSRYITALANILSAVFQFFVLDSYHYAFYQ